MSEGNTGLTKVEVLWGEIVEMANKIDLIGNKIVDAEVAVGNTVTSLEESLTGLVAKMKELSDSADGVISEKQVELKRQIELALAQGNEKTAQRDLEVVEMISEAVENRVGQLHDSVGKQLTDSVHANSMHIQAEANKHLTRATQSIERANKADKAIFVSLAVILILMFASICSYAAWHVAYLHFSNSANIAEQFITTPDGKAAIEFAKLNDIEKMLDCNGFKETTQGPHTYCVPMDRNRNVSGWRIK